jgi:hypothetical protein
MEKEHQLPFTYLLLFLWKIRHIIRKFQQDRESGSSIIPKHLGKLGLYETRHDNGMLPVDQADESWVTCFLDKDIPQSDVGGSTLEITLEVQEV